MAVRARSAPAAPTPALSGFSKRTYRVPAFARDAWYLARRRQVLRAALSGGRIDDRRRELIKVAVAYVNDCRYCVAAHHELALAAGAAPAELDAIADGESDGLDAKTAAAIAYASALAQAEFGRVPEARVELAGFLSDEEFDDVELIARAMAVVNRLGNTLDALRSRRTGRPDPSGRLLDELVLSALILAAAVPVLLIGARRGRSFHRKASALLREDPWSGVHRP